MKLILVTRDCSMSGEEDRMVLVVNDDAVAETMAKLDAARASTSEVDITLASPDALDDVIDFLREDGESCARDCDECGEEFYPENGEYHRCPDCLAQQDAAAEAATGVS